MKQPLATITAAISLTLLSFTCSANADSLGINKDCDNHPVSQYGIDSIAAFGEYKADPKKFMDAMASFCNKGKTMGDMGFDTADEHSLTASIKWVNSNLSVQNDEQRKFASVVSGLLYDSMLNGFTGFDYPDAPEKITTPTASFNPASICDALSNRAAEYSATQLPPQVQISLQEWKQIKSEFEMVCLAGIVSGNSRQSADKKLLAGLNDTARDVYMKAHEIGSKNPKYRMPDAGNDAVTKAENKKASDSVDDLFNDLRSGKNEVKTNGESKPAKVKSLSPEEMKERQDIQSYGTEIRNAFGRISEGTSGLTGQKCSVKIWFSQNGNVLSTKVESGDDDACSYILRRAKGMKLGPMNDSQYKAFRNTHFDFSF